MVRDDSNRFDTLLKLRRQKEEEAQRTVAARLGHIRQLEDRRTALEQRITQQSERTRSALETTGTLNLDDLRLSRHWMIRLRQGLLQAEAEMRTQRALLAAERSQLAETTKDRKSLSLWKERRLERYWAEQARAEQAAADEMNVLRFVHARRAEMETESP